MNDWTAGYVADIGYTYGYYPELNPRRIELPFLNHGLVQPRVETACELGFGQGISVNLHSAASPVQWYGTDFNPAQTGFAQDLAGAAGTGPRLCDEAFAEFSARPDLPEFDFVGVHGIWSWISDANRAVIVDFVRRKLKVGGVLYISYNTQPGWAAMLPMRELLCEHAEVMGAAGAGIVSRIDAALDFAGRLLATNPLFARVNPSVAERIKRMSGQNRNYLAHEYFNRDWHPMSFARMAEWLAPAKLGFACSASYTDHVDAVNLSPEQQAFLKEIPDPMFREAVRDFVVNTQFRRDYWVKGVRKLDAVDRSERIRAQRVILVSPRADVELKVSGSLGEATLNEGVYGAILDLIADHRPYSLGQIETSLVGKGVTFGQILQALMILIGKADVAPAQDEAAVAKTKKAADRLNLQLMKMARGSNDNTNLASPVTGGGVAVNRFQQLFLLARLQGRKTPAEWAHFVWQHLEFLGQRLTREGRPVESREENLAELSRQAEEFAQKRLPVLRALQIC